MNTYATDRFYRADGLARTVDGAMIPTVTYTYESGARLYDVRDFSTPGGVVRGYRVNMGAWSEVPERAHTAIVAHFNL